jgi:PiT family inorganic phosphate transporter
MDILSLAILAAALLVGLGIGANVASNSIGVIVGSGMMSFRKAALLTSVFMLLGALLSGGAVTKTIGCDLMMEKSCPVDPAVAVYGTYEKDIALSALLAAIILVSVATYLSIPVAMGHAMVGAIIGAIAAAGLFGGLDKSIISGLIISWISTPLMAIILAAVIYKYLVTPLSRGLGLIGFTQLFQLLLLAGSAFLAYSIGANNVGNALGPLLGAAVLGDRLTAVLVIGVSMGAGASIFSRRVVDTVSKRILSMGPTIAFTAQMAAAIVIFIFAALGVPVSSTQAVIGGLVGVGLSKGMRTVNVKTMVYVLLGWVLTPVTAGLLSMVFYWLLSGLNMLI